MRRLSDEKILKAINKCESNDVMFDPREYSVELGAVAKAQAHLTLQEVIEVMEKTANPYALDMVEAQIFELARQSILKAIKELGE